MVRWGSPGLLLLSWLVGLGLPPVLAQREFHIWGVGPTAGASTNLRQWRLDFNRQQPVVYPSPIIAAHTGGGVVSLSTPCGRLLFASQDGLRFSGNNGNLIPNGDTLHDLGFKILSGIRRTQRLLALPQPLHRTRYWFFAASSYIGAETPLTYGILDMALNNGRGKVLTKSVRFTPHSTRMVAAARHANKRDFWVLTRDIVTHEYLAYPLTPHGLHFTPVRSASLYQPDSIGSLRFSADDRWLVSTGVTGHPGNWQIAQVLARFDPATGRVSEERALEQAKVTSAKWHFPIMYAYWGAEFSADSRRLYLATMVDGRYDTLKLVQYDLTQPANSLSRSRLVVGRLTASQHSHSPFTSLGFSLQLTPRGEIAVLGAEDYIGPDMWLPVIRRPNELGPACGVDIRGYQLPFQSVESAPNIVNGMMLDTLPEIRHDPPRCGRDSLQFWPANPGCAEALTWSFGDPASGAANQSTAWFPRHLFSGPGRYPVTLTFDDGRVLQKLVVVPGDTASILATGGVCGTDTVQFAITNPGCADSVRWSFGDAAAGTTNASTAWQPRHVFSQPGTYSVTAWLSDGRTLHRRFSYEPRPVMPPAPDAFTPNADGLNDTFLPAPGMAPAQYNLRIYNRWGVEVFATHDPARAWTGDGLAPGVYFYYLTATDCAGQPVRQRGTVSLFR